MVGLALLREIKSRFPNLPIMMVTAYGDDKRRRLAANSAPSEFLTKPVDFDHLKGQLRQLSAAADWSAPISLSQNSICEKNSRC